MIVVSVKCWHLPLRNDESFPDMKINLSFVTMAAGPTRAGLVLLMALLACTVVVAAPPAQQLERFRAADEPVSMGFVQTLVDANGEVIERQEGRLEILPPNRFRWRYESPYEVEFGSNGVLVWHWDHELAQITVRDARKAVQGTPLAMLLDGETELPLTAEGDWLTWAPQGDEAQFARLQLRLRGDAPREFVLIDALDQTTRVVFADMRRPDPDVDPRFPKIGPEVLVVDERDTP